MPLPNELTDRVLDLLEDRDVLAWRGVSRACQAQAEDPHIWFRRVGQRGYLRPAAAVHWPQADMLAHYRAQTSFVDPPLANYTPRLLVDTADTRSTVVAEKTLPTTLPQMHISGESGEMIPWLVEHWPHLRHLEIQEMTSMFASKYIDALGVLASLESLSLGGFGLWSLSGRVVDDVARALPKLRRLCIQRGMLEGEGLRPLSAMTQLETLTLRDMPELVSFAADMEPMPSVTVLDLSCIETTSWVSRQLLLDIVRIFPNLLELKLVSRSVEDESDLGLLGALPLTSLNLSSTDVMSLPDVLCTPVLERLDVSRNDYFLLPAAASNMKRLVELDVSDTDLARLPWVVSQMTSLRKLDLSSNARLRIDVSLPMLRDLRALNLSNCNLQRVPHVVLDLRSLRRLQLNGNELKGLPLRFERLDKLTHLDLRNNDKMWTAMPRALRHMRGMTWFGAPSLHRKAFPRLATSFPNLRYVALEEETVWDDKRGRELIRPPFQPREILNIFGGSKNLRFAALDGNWLHPHRATLHAEGVRPHITYASNFTNTWTWP